MTPEEEAQPGAVEGAEPEVAAPRARPDRARRRLAVACAALFGLSVGLAVLAAVLSARLADERDRHQAIEEVAGRFAAALLTYDFEKLDASKQRVLELSTGNFRKEYERAFVGGLDKLYLETKARSVGTVKDVFVGTVEDDTANAIVVADAVAEGTSGTRRRLDSYIQLDLVRVGGRWRVDGVTSLNFGQEPGSATTTTAPVK